MANAAATEKQIPTALIIAGAGLWMVAGFMGNGVHGASNALAAVGIIATVNVVFMIVGAFITAAVLRISFGELQSAILKLGAIALFPGAIGFLVPGVGGLIALALYFSLLIWFFELEVYQAIVFTIVLFLIRLLVGVMFV